MLQSKPAAKYRYSEEEEEDKLKSSNSIPKCMFSGGFFSEGLKPLSQLWWFFVIYLTGPDKEELDMEEASYDKYRRYVESWCRRSFNRRSK